MTNKAVVEGILENMWRDSGFAGDINIADDEDKIDEAVAQLCELIVKTRIEGAKYQTKYVKELIDTGYRTDTNLGVVNFMQMLEEHADILNSLLDGKDE